MKDDGLPDSYQRVHRPHPTGSCHAAGDGSKAAMRASVRSMKKHLARYVSRTNWERLRNMKDADIDYSDAPEMPEGFWDKAEVRLPAHIPKQLISLRIHQDIIEYFKRQGPRYQSRMNAALRAYVKAAQAMEAEKPGKKPARRRH